MEDVPHAMVVASSEQSKLVVLVVITIADSVTRTVVVTAGNVESMVSTIAGPAITAPLGFVSVASTICFGLDGVCAGSCPEAEPGMELHGSNARVE